jgi:hypothetical protein
MTGKALAAVAAAAVALLAAGSAQPRLHASGGPLGIAEDQASAYLMRLSPRNLRPADGEKLALGLFMGGWAFSPDRTTLALTLAQRSDPAGDPPASVHFVDVAGLKTVGEVSVGAGYAWYAAWLAPDRLVVILVHCCIPTGPPAEVVLVDPVAQRVVGRHSLPDSNPISIRQGGGRLAILSGSWGAIRPATLTIVDGSGTVRSVVLGRIEAGAERTGTASDPGLNEVDPGLAVEQDGRRAMIVSTTGLVADVDLASLGVTYHSIAAGRALAVAAKTFEGSARHAELLADGTLVVSGWDKHARYVPAGLKLVDTRTWTARTVDRKADTFWIVGDTVLATGSRPLFAADLYGPWVGSGLSGYSRTGKRRFHFFKLDQVSVEAYYGDRVYAYLSDRVEPNPLRVVDVRTGKVVGRRARETMPQILEGSSSVSR